jgi:hypothetical protein
VAVDAARIDAAASRKRAISSEKTPRAFVEIIQSPVPPVLFGEILRLSPRLSQPKNRLIRPLADSGGCARDVRSLYGVKTAGTKKILPESSLCVLCTFARDQS